MKKNKLTFIFLLFLLLFISCSKKNIKEYYPDGRLKEEYTLLKGKKEGLCKSFYPSGKIKFEVTFKNGRENGMVKSYYENGNLKFKGVLKDNQPQGWYVFYDKNNKLDSMVEYVMIDYKRRFTSYLDSVPDSLKSPISNRYLLYNKKGKLDEINSLYFLTALKNDTISLRDTLFLKLSLFSLFGHKPQDFIVNLSNPFKNEVYLIQPSDSVCYFYLVPNRKGAGVMTGTISLKEDKGNYYYFNKKYFVK